ncbi:hypothetical protein BJY16_006161 [Actinoplanes octamycinicus]|uniref:Uncharacterized protein n=1 Tax=Actinoplanes octamycinicus TaxID=135948 RepID=A0A7W7H2Z0_9ACTN|nr:hypothetical protein [Actinoplanes octamycinicus]MBB4742702.1 hypothetical protein [Actinoplanes octamycinicus]GIE63003.1 hypothetical protein Aoc01nite_84050 [Actinoplanes octamycinicus]
MADTTVWTPVIAGGIGVLGAVLGALVTHLGTSRRDEQQGRRQRAEKLRDTRAALFLDLMEFLENLDNRLLVDLSQRDGFLDQMPDVQHPGRLSARVDLYADPDLRRAWARVVDAEYAIRSEWDDPTGENPHELIEDARTAVATVQGLLRERVATLA